MIDKYRDTGRPLGSLALLLSEATPHPLFDPGTGEPHFAEPATIDNVVAAVKEWKDRGG